MSLNFRGRHKELEQMIYSKEICGHIEYSTNLIDALNTMLNEDDYDIEVMQYTGLKDKNGVQIFEGDIVILCWSDEVGGSHWGKVIIKNPFEYTLEEARYFIYSDEIEVIGNIYENPELLEESE